MPLKVAVLQSQEQIIADLKEIVSEDKTVAYLLNKPHIIEINRFSLTEEGQPATSVEVTLSPWIISSAEDDIPVPTQHVITIVEPLDSVKQMYEAKLNGRRNQSDQTDSSDDGQESDKSD